MIICIFLFFIPQALTTFSQSVERFYDNSKREFLKFASRGKVFLIGDTNARLGSLLDDKNSKGQITTNPNKELFMEFLQF